MVNVTNGNAENHERHPMAKALHALLLKCMEERSDASFSILENFFDHPLTEFAPQSLIRQLRYFKDNVQQCPHTNGYDPSLESINRQIAALEAGMKEKDENKAAEKYKEAYDINNWIVDIRHGHTDLSTILFLPFKERSYVAGKPPVYSPETGRKLFNIFWDKVFHADPPLTPKNKDFLLTEPNENGYSPLMEAVATQDIYIFNCMVAGLQQLSGERLAQQLQKRNFKSQDCFNIIFNDGSIAMLDAFVGTCHQAHLDKWVKHRIVPDDITQGLLFRAVKRETPEMFYALIAVLLETQLMSDMRDYLIKPHPGDNRFSAHVANDVMGTAIKDAIKVLEPLEPTLSRINTLLSTIHTYITPDLRESGKVIAAMVEVEEGLRKIIPFVARERQEALTDYMNDIGVLRLELQAGLPDSHQKFLRELRDVIKGIDEKVDKEAVMRENKRRATQYFREKAGLPSKAAPSARLADTAARSVPMQDGDQINRAG